MPVKLNGATSGSVELNVPAAIGSDLQLTLPATAGEVIVKAADGSVDLGSVDITSSGNVGIGTSSPSSILETKGAHVAFKSPNNTSRFFYDCGDGNGGELSIYSAAGAQSTRIGATSNSLFGGNLGNGTSSPRQLLHLKNSASPAIQISDGTNNQFISSIKTAGNFANGSTAGDVFIRGQSGFAVSSNNGSSVAMRIDSSGNVGIGDSSPSGKLEIRGASTVGTNTGHIVLSGDSATVGQGPQITFSESGSGSSTAGAYIGHGREGSNSIGFLSFGTRSSSDANVVPAERMRIDSSGRVGIGTSSATELLSVDGNIWLGNTAGSETLRIWNDSSISRIHASNNQSALTFGVGGHTSTYERMRITSGGRMYLYGNPNLFISNTAGAGTSQVMIAGGHSASSVTSSTLSFRVYNNGNVQNTNNSYGSISDAKLKENIVDASSQWDDLKAIQVRNYNFIEGQTHTQIGVVAQEVETVSPGLVTESPDRDAEGEDLGTTTKSVNYSVLYMKAVKALQEAMERIETLETKVASLEASS